VSLGTEEQATASGPCVYCGATNYALSLGGPAVCPACDCGRPDPALVAIRNAQLTAERDALLSEVRGLREAGLALVEASMDVSSGGVSNHRRTVAAMDERRLALQRILAPPDGNLNRRASKALGGGE